MYQNGPTSGSTKQYPPLGNANSWVHCRRRIPCSVNVAHVSEIWACPNILATFRSTLFILAVSAHAALPG
jgi:hypothetical protein